MNTSWYRSAFMYALQIETFADSDGDGYGDVQGLISRLDYLKNLGVNCIWLQPFYPAPTREYNYNVSDHYNVDPRMGTLGDFVELTEEMRKRDMHLIINLIITHTSKQHHWFTKARRDPDSRYRNYYLWSTDANHKGESALFVEKGKPGWTFDEEAGAYYMYRHYREQPDLNLALPAVQDEFFKVITFWLNLEVSGFFVEAPVITAQADLIKRDQVLALLEKMRQFILKKKEDAILIANACDAAIQLDSLFGQGNRAHMVFNDTLQAYIYLALARQNPGPVIKALSLLPEIPEQCQWVNFLRSHDEVQITALDPVERNEVHRAFARREEARLSGRSIRRRVMPLLSGDRPKLELAYSLLFSLPGTPLLCYGDEIGMGDNLELLSRMSVRTPMQWNKDVNGGFSTAAPELLVHPVVAEGTYGFMQVNAADQTVDSGSLHSWLKGLFQKRREYPEFRVGTFELIETNCPDVLAHRCTWHHQSVVALHNFSDRPQEVIIKDNPNQLLSLFSDGSLENGAVRNEKITLRPFGYCWLWVKNLQSQVPTGSAIDYRRTYTEVSA